MYELSVIYAKDRITKAVIIRLIYNVFLLLLCARTYSNTADNLRRIHSNENSLFFILGFLAFDSLLTLLWTNKSKLYYYSHMLFYGLLGLIFDGIFLLEVFLVTVTDNPANPAYGEDRILYFVPLMWAVGWVTFAMCSSGKKELKKLKMLMQNNSEA